MARFDVITFDCYGTLIDWESGIAGAFRSAAAGRAALPAAAELLSAYAAIEPEVEAGPYRSYREILTETAVRVAGRFGWAIAPAEASFLADSLAFWRPFPDTNAALRRLAVAGCRLGILSNVDDDLFAGTRLHLDAAFDPVITAAQVRSYKPAFAHFEAARRVLPPATRWLHAAQSYFHDVTPCRALGIPVAWINRKGETAGAAGPPDSEWRDLSGLADWVERG